MTKPSIPEDELDIILKRFIADVEDSVEFIGTQYNPEDKAHDKVASAIELAKLRLRQYAAKARLEEIQRFVAVWIGSTDDKTRNYLEKRIKQLKEGM